MKTHTTRLTSEDFTQFVEANTTLPPELTLRELKNQEGVPTVVVYYEFPPNPEDGNAKRDFITRFYPWDKETYLYPKMLEYPELVKVIKSFCLLYSIHVEDWTKT